MHEEKKRWNFKSEWHPEEFDNHSHFYDVLNSEIFDKLQEFCKKDGVTFKRYFNKEYPGFHIQNKESEEFWDYIQEMSDSIEEILKEWFQPAEVETIETDPCDKGWHYWRTPQNEHEADQSLVCRLCFTAQDEHEENDTMRTWPESMKNKILYSMRKLANEQGELEEYDKFKEAVDKYWIKDAKERKQKSRYQRKRKEKGNAKQTR